MKLFVNVLNRTVDGHVCYPEQTCLLRQSIAEHLEVLANGVDGLEAGEIMGFISSVNSVAVVADELNPHAISSIQNTISTLVQYMKASDPATQSMYIYASSSGNAVSTKPTEQLLATIDNLSKARITFRSAASANLSFSNNSWSDPLLDTLFQINSFIQNTLVLGEDPVITSRASFKTMNKVIDIQDVSSHGEIPISVHLTSVEKLLEKNSTSIVFPATSEGKTMTGLGYKVPLAEDL